MLVRFHDETGDERKAVAAPLPRTIGNVQTAAGSGPLPRAIATSAQATAADPRNRSAAGANYAVRIFSVPVVTK